MKTSLEHLPERKQRELARVVGIIQEEFADLVERSKSDAKKDGRIFKIILFGSYARGTWVDEPHTSKGYRSDFDILVIVSNKELADPKYWDKTTDRLMWDKEIETPVGLIVHGAREISNFLHDGQPFFVDLAREGVVPVRTRRPAARRAETAQPCRCNQGGRGAFRKAVQECSRDFLEGVRSSLSWKSGYLNLAAFTLHQAVETAYNCYLLTH